MSQHIPEELVPFKQIAIGGNFYIAKYPGNTYRKIDEKTAEFVAHRLNRAYIGCRITKSPTCPVLRQPLTPEELDFLGIDPDHNPFHPTWTPPEGYELLAGGDDFSHLLDTDDEENLLN